LKGAAFLAEQDAQVPEADVVDPSATRKSAGSTRLQVGKLARPRLEAIELRALLWGR
jgi:hypothetical protein